MLAAGGMRVHGTTQCWPLEHFGLEEQSLLPVQAEHYDVPVYAICRVHRDDHIEIAKALYSISGNCSAPASRSALTASSSGSFTARS